MSPENTISLYGVIHFSKIMVSENDKYRLGTKVEVSSFLRYRGLQNLCNKNFIMYQLIVGNVKCYVL